MATEPVLAAEWEKVGVWTALGAPRRVNYKRGKLRAHEKASPGVMTLTLPNEARQLDPDHNAAVALLQPGVRIRLRATWAAVTYTLFTGYMERQWDEGNGPHDAVTVIQATDGLAILANAGLKTPWEIAMQALTPRSWFRLGETVGPYAYDRTGRSIAIIVGPVELGETSLLSADEDPSMGFPNTNNAYIATYPETVPTTASWSVSMVAKFGTALPAGNQVIVYDTRHPYGFKVILRTDGVLVISHIKDTGGISQAQTNVNVCDDVVHTYNFVFTNGATPKIYLGNVDYTAAGALGTTHTPSPGVWAVGISAYVPIQLDELRTFDFAITPAQMLALDNAALGWPNDSVLTRVGRILDAAAWPVGLRSITTESDGLLRGITETDLVALPHLQAIETTLEGRLWITPDGTLKLMGRNEFLTTNDTSLATFADADSGAGLGYTGLGAWVRDWALVANVVRRINGDNIVTAQDATSIAQYGLRDQGDAAEVESLYATLAADSDLAYFRLAHYKNPIPYVEGLEITPRNDPANLWPQVLARDLADRITLKSTPQGIGATRTMETIIEGIQVDIAPKHWVVNYSIDATAAQLYFQFDVTLWDSPDWRFSA